MTRTFTLLVVLAFVLLIAQSHVRVQANGGSKHGAMSKVSTELRALHQEYGPGPGPSVTFQQQTGSPASASRNPLIKIVDDKVVVDIVASGDVDALRSELEALGMEQISTYRSLISGLMPISGLDSLSDLEDLRFVHPSYAMTSVGSTSSGGDAAMKSNDVRTNSGLNGTGVTIGVLSDSFDCDSGAATDAADDVSSGDLPPGVVVLRDLSSGCTDEGRAMMQIIHDVAPGAGQAFHTAFLGKADFASGITELRTVAGADIIVDDVIYLTEPFFQDGIIAQAVDDAVADGAAYFSSAGNAARNSYESTYLPGASFSSGQIPPGPPTFWGGTAHDFGGGDYFQSITIPEGRRVSIAFQWDEPHASVSGGAGSTNDLDMYLLNSANTVVLTGSTDDNTGADPVEFLSYLNPSGSGVTNFNIMITQFSGPDPGLIKYIMIGSGPTINEYDTASSTSFGHANAAGAMAVGAAFYGNTPEFGVSPPLLESFSSAGPVPILFDTAGNPISETRMKPGIVGPDGVNTTFFGNSDPSPGGAIEADGFPNFFGTSAAAPHAAGVAALMLESNHLLSPARIYDALESTAIDMGTPGFDFDTGYGFIDAEQAVQAARPITFALDAQADLVATTTTVAIVLSEAPGGISEFDLDITLSGSGIQISNVIYNPGLSPTMPTNLPDSQVNLFASDPSDLINSNSTGITLVTLEVQALAKGATSLVINNGTLGLQDDSSTQVDAQFQSGTVTVTNIPPVVDAGAGASINEGDTFSDTGSFTDPDNSSLTGMVDYGDGLGFQPLTIAASSTTFALDHTYDDEGSYLVTVNIDDGDGGVDSDSATVNVQNVAPSISLPASASVDEDIAFDLTDSFTDPGNDNWSGTVDYGDGAGPQPLSIVPASTTFSLNHTYPDPGTYQVAVSLDDNDGGTDSKTITLDVIDVFPTLAGESAPVQDLDSDGYADDTNGNGVRDFDDVVSLFQNMTSTEVLNNQNNFDYNGNGGIDFNDIVTLFLILQGLP